MIGGRGPQPGRGRVDGDGRHRVPDEGVGGAAQSIPVSDPDGERSGHDERPPGQQPVDGRPAHGRHLVRWEDRREGLLPEIVGPDAPVTGVVDERHRRRQVLDVDRPTAELAEQDAVRGAERGQGEQRLPVVG